MTSRTPADIYLLGSGMLSFVDITLATQDVLTKCSTVCYLHDLPSLDRYLQKICKKPINLMPMYYTDGRVRSDIYDDIVAHVMKLSAQEKPIALLLHGHPLVYSSVSQRLIMRATEAQKNLVILPGISSLDQIWVDLKLDIAIHGVQIFSALHAIQHDITLNPRVGTLLLQTGHALSHHAERTTTNTVEETLPLKTYLLKFFSKDHRVQLVECAVEISIPNRVLAAEIGRLEEIAQTMNYNATMYIPPIV